MALRPSVFFFFDSGKQGWVERYWYTSTGSLLAVAEAGKELLKKRAKMLATGIVIPNAFASYDDEFRDVQPITIPVPGAGYVWNTKLVSNPEQPNVSIMLRMFAGDRAGKMTYISGVPDDTVAFPPLYEPMMSDAWNSAFNAFRLQLINENWGWKGLTYDPLLAPTSNLLNLANAVNRWDATVVSTVGFKAGRLVKLSGADFSGTARGRGNRVYTIETVTPPDGLSLLWRGASLTGLTWLGGGQVQQQTFQLLKITEVKIEKIATRKRGVGFARPAGRRRRRI